MSFDPGDDALVRMLAALPAMAPDESRSTRVRARCQEALTRRAQVQRPGAPCSAKLLMMLCVVYAAELMRLVVAFDRAS